MSGPFLDTNVLVYAFDGTATKADVAEELLTTGGVVSVQVLNELANVARRKLKLSFAELGEALGVVRALCEVVPVSVETHALALALAERYQLGIFDACIVASAELAGCSTLYSEDMHDGQQLDAVLICNPFVR